MNWCGQVQRMDKERLPQRILEWWPPGRQRKGRPRSSWMQEVTTGMRERRIGDLEWVDKEGWRKKKITLGTEGCEKIKNLFINKIKKEKWIRFRDTLINTTEDICGRSRGIRRSKETP